MSQPRVVVWVPAGWGPRGIAPPKLNESSGAVVVEHAALAHPEGGVVTFGCVATGIPGWVEDMRPAVEGKMVALAGASATLARGAPIDARPEGTGAFELRDANDPGGPVIGRARTFLGFDASRVHTCFVTCTGAPACEAVIDGSRLEGSSAPPAPGVALAAVTWAVHHPRPFALGLGAALAAAAGLAVALRRRPRHGARI